MAKSVAKAGEAVTTVRAEAQIALRRAAAPGRTKASDRRKREKLPCSLKIEIRRRAARSPRRSTRFRIEGILISGRGRRTAGA